MRSLYLVLALLALPALADAPVFPALVNPATADHHPGKIVWADLVTPDLHGSEAFYSGLFGWTFRDASIPDKAYAIAYAGSRPVAGLLQHALDPTRHRRPAWLTFISVRDVDAAVQAAADDGGKVLVPARDYPARGRQAILADPDGAVFAVLASTSGDPPDDLSEPGEFIWSSLQAHDPDREAAFYQNLFGYEVFDLQSNDGLAHLVFSAGDYARAGLNELLADSVRRHPHWLDFVRVVDVAAAARAASSLGGRVLVEPRADRQGAHLAVIADPSGAVLGLMDWPGDAGKREPK